MGGLRIRHIVAAIVGCFAIMGLSGTAQAATAQFEIRGYVPLICSAQMGPVSVNSGSMLTIDAMVTQSCNASHKLSVRYEGLGLVDPSDLSVDYAGRTPEYLNGERATFAQERYVQAQRLLHMTWLGGTEEERMQFATTVTVVVTPV